MSQHYTDATTELYERYWWGGVRDVPACREWLSMSTVNARQCPPTTRDVNPRKLPMYSKGELGFGQLW